MRGLRRASIEDLAALVALQQAAYARNRALMGVEPLPLKADYREVLARYETWLVERDGTLAAALILEPRADDLLIWSVAVAPQAQRRGLGRRLLAAAEDRAATLGKRTMRLYTGEKMTGNIAWYQRHGYAVEHIEQRPDRRVVHMVKPLASD
jgi:ribosomal protein S18 acetylase RimI-like enzyme